DCLPWSCDDPTPRMLTVATRESPLLLTITDGEYCSRSMKVVMPAFLISADEIAVIEIGTSLRFSSRFCAVTISSSTSRPASAAAATDGKTVKATPDNSAATRLLRPNWTMEFPLCRHLLCSASPDRGDALQDKKHKYYPISSGISVAAVQRAHGAQRARRDRTFSRRPASLLAHRR